MSQVAVYGYLTRLRVGKGLSDAIVESLVVLG
jgi:hypothetical protein